MPENPTVRVAAVQMEPRLGDLAGNLDAILERLAKAADAGARLVVFPECALTGYGFTSKAEALGVAEPIPGPGTERLAGACDRLGAHAIVGLLERDGDRLFNACAWIGPGGLVGSYRKIHLPCLGVDRFTDPGDRPFGVVDAAGLKVGMHICYDGSFPEPARVLTLLGAELLALPTNWPEAMARAAEVLMPCRAIENVAYAMAVNRVGVERGFRFCGLSSIVDPSGNVLAQAGPDAEAILLADVDPALARRKRLVRVPGEYEVDRIADRRPEFYGPIVAEDLTPRPRPPRGS